jgi:hypothetical protein
VLDHINTKSDLKALCLTSKGFRDLVLPHLYHTVYLRTWDAHLVTFFKSVAAGAGLHLRHTRALLFEDTRPPAEPTSVRTSNSSDRQSVDRAARDERIHLILELIPSHVLRTVRYVLHLTQAALSSQMLTTYSFTSERHTPNRTSQHILRNQRNVLRMTDGWINPVDPTYLLPFTLQSLDLICSPGSYTASMLESVCNNEHMSLNVLSLSNLKRTSQHDDTLTLCVQSLPAASKLMRFGEVNISGFSLEDL